MTIIVQKFGGTSVATIERIRNVASRVKRELDNGHHVAVIVSAMSGVTDQLVGWTNEVSALDNAASLAEYDSIVSSGEQVTSGILALVLQSMGIPARSWLGWQLALKTDNTHSKARIEEIVTEDILDGFKRGEVAVLAGFQGVHNGRITTLGRGGSDTSAVALAASLNAERCDIYTDVDGVYTTDPRIVEKARKLETVTYEEMLEMASLGAKVLQTRSVEMAMKHHVRVQVLSSFSDEPGTMVIGEEESMEKQLITGIAYSRNESRVSLMKVPDHPGVAAAIFGPLAEAEINVDMIVQNISEDTKETDLTFTVPNADLDRTVTVFKNLQGSLQYKNMLVDKNVAKISVIGVGMRSHAGIAQKMFKTLADKNINILVISTSEIKISVLIAAEYTELAIRALHTAYELDAA